MKPGALISLYLAVSKVGSGTREFLVLKRGRRHAELLYLPTLAKVAVSVDDLDRGTELPPRRGLATRIRRTRQERERFQLPWSKAGTAAAIKVLASEGGDGRQPRRHSGGDDSTRPLQHRPEARP